MESPAWSRPRRQFWANGEAGGIQPRLHSRVPVVPPPPRTTPPGLSPSLPTCSLYLTLSPPLLKGSLLPETPSLTSLLPVASRAAG